MGEGQDVYFECLSQANPPVCWKTYFLISEMIKTRISVDWQHLQVYKIQWLHDGYTVEGSTTGQVNHVHDTVDKKTLSPPSPSPSLVITICIILVSRPI